MYNSYKWKPSKKSINDFKEKMEEIEVYCKENGISQSVNGDSYYFSIGKTDYRVSNHTREASNRKSVNQFGQEVRDKYHDLSDKSMVEITASKTRLIQVHKDLLAGKKLDKRGFEV